MSFAAIKLERKVINTKIFFMSKLFLKLKKSIAVMNNNLILCALKMDAFKPVKNIIYLLHERLKIAVNQKWHWSTSHFCPGKSLSG